MSNVPTVTNRRNEIQTTVESTSWFRNFLNAMRVLMCGCAKGVNNMDEPHMLHAVDSVRLVYMRRIEEENLLHGIRQNQQTAIPVEDTETRERIVRRRGLMRPELATLEALEKALKEYETKNHRIISSTRMPSNKASRVSRASQTEPKATTQLLEDSESVVINEEIRRVVAYSSIDELNLNVDKEISDSDTNPEEINKPEKYKHADLDLTHKLTDTTDDSNVISINEVIK